MGRAFLVWKFLHPAGWRNFHIWILTHSEILYSHLYWRDTFSIFKLWSKNRNKGFFWFNCEMFCRLQLQLHQIFTYLFIWAIFGKMNDFDPMSYDLPFVFYWLLSHTCLWLCFSSNYPWPSFFLLSCMCNILDIYYSDMY